MSFSLVPVLDRVDHAPAPGRWRDAAACADPDLDRDLRAVFITDAATDDDPAAVAVCAGCPVLTDCAGNACRVRGLVGIWGGRRRPGRHASLVSRVGSDFAVLG